MSLKGKLAVGFGLFLATALAVLGMIALGVVIDTGVIAAIIFCLNAAFHWCGGWQFIGLYKTLAYGFASALVFRVLRIISAVLS
jgi:hypothetical protein